MKQLVSTSAICCLFLIALAACHTDARQQLMATSAGPGALRSIQTRVIDTTDRVKTLTTIIATLQDLEFLIDRADASLGVVTATKTKQLTQLRLSITIHPHGKNQILVRANGQFKFEAIDDPEFYQQFFAALQRSMFLTAHESGAPTAVSGSLIEPRSKGSISAAATGSLETGFPGPSEVKATPEAGGSSPSLLPIAAVPTKAAISPNATPFDGLWLLEIGIANGGGQKDRVQTVVTNGRFLVSFKTDGWKGSLGGEINKYGMLTVQGTVNKMGAWYSGGGIEFETHLKNDRFHEIVQSKARVSESFDVSFRRL